MSRQNKKRDGWGCSNIPISLIIAILGGSYWWLSQPGNLNVSKLLPKNIGLNIPIFNPTLTDYPTPDSSLPSSSNLTTNNNKQSTLKKVTHPKASLAQTSWNKKGIRGIYLSRYQVTNNADEQTIRQRVRYYRSQGINTIIHGVWGNGCTMYNSEVMQQTLGSKSCPNQFQERWLKELIDEAHKQGMQVHAYFEKGIKIDKNSPIYDLAIEQKWIVPGVDKTYVGIDHYVLDVHHPEIANLFRNILVEFVQKYPKIDAVQWDDYLGYYAQLPGKVDLG